MTVTGVDDFVQDGDVAYTIVTAAATSADPNYNGLNAADVAVTNTGQRHGRDQRLRDQRPTRPRPAARPRSPWCWTASPRPT